MTHASRNTTTGLLFEQHTKGEAIGIPLHKKELGRYYTDFTEDTMQNMIRGISELSLIKMWFTQDIRTNNDTKWLNILCSKSYVVV